MPSNGHQQWIPTMDTNQNQHKYQQTKSFNLLENPNLIKLGLVSFFSDLASELLYPITPIFMSQILGASMFSIGLVEGLAEAIAALVKAYSGYFSDKFGQRKKFVLLGYTLAAIAKPAVGFSQTILQVIGARSLDRFGKGIRGAPRDAMIADSVQDSHLGQAFGWHRFMDTLGAAFGPIVGLLYLNYFQSGGDLRSIYMWAIVPGVLSVICVFIIKEKSIVKSDLLNEHKTKQEVNQKNLRKESWLNEFKLFSNSYKILLLCIFIFSIGNSSDVFLLLKAQKEHLSLNWVVGIYCFYNLVYALSSPYFGRLSDRYSKSTIYLLGLTIYASVYIGFVWARQIEHFMFLFLLYGFYMAISDGVVKALIVTLIPQNRRASGLGVMSAVSSLGVLIASPLAGYFWDSFGTGYPFILAFVCSVTSFFILTFAKMKKLI